MPGLSSIGLTSHRGVERGNYLNRYAQFIIQKLGEIYEKKDEIQNLDCNEGVLSRKFKFATIIATTIAAHVKTGTRKYIFL